MATPEEMGECEHDKFSARFRRRRMALLVGHADFMSLILKRIVCGYGHSVEHQGISHRSAFVHANTGLTELEYFGNGRFLLMGTNQIPHLLPCEYPALRGGDSLKDGWSWVVPSEEILLNSEVAYAYTDEQMDDHVREPTQALKSLYLPSKSATIAKESSTVEKQATGYEVTFFVKRGLQVVGCVSYNEVTGKVSDNAICIVMNYMYSTRAEL